MDTDALIRAQIRVICVRCSGDYDSSGHTWSDSLWSRDLLDFLWPLFFGVVFVELSVLFVECSLVMEIYGLDD